MGRPDSPAFRFSCRRSNRRSRENGGGFDHPGDTTGHRSGAPMAGWPAERRRRLRPGGPTRQCRHLRLCGMAFMSGGSTPGRGPYGKPVQQAVHYLLANAQPSGFIVEPTPTTHGPMYSHGFATLFLAECCGMSRRTELRDKLGLAVKLIVNSQNKEGGWRDYPEERRRRHLRDGLPGDGPPRRAQRGPPHSQGDHRSGGQIRGGLPEPRRRFRLHAQRRRRKFLSALGGRGRGPEQRRHLSRTEKRRTASHPRIGLSDAVPPRAERHAARAVL